MNPAAALCGRLHVRVAVVTTLGFCLPGVALATDASLFVEIEGEIPCPSPTALAQALTQRLFSARVILGPAPDQAARLVLSSAQRAELRVELSLGAGGAHFSRVLSARSEECDQLAETAAHLVAAWLEQVAWNAEVDASRQFSVAPLPPSPEPPKSPAAPEQPPLPEPVAPAPPETPPPPSPTARRNDKWPVFPALQAGPYYEPQARRIGFHLVAGAQARINAAWGLGLDLGVDTPMRATVAPGQVVVHAATVAASASLSAYHGSAGQLDLLGSLGVERISATGTGYTLDASATGYGLSGTLLLRWGRPLFWALKGTVFAGVQVRAPARDIGIVGLGTFLPLSPLRPWCGLGFSWDP